MTHGDRQKVNDLKRLNTLRHHLSQIAAHADVHMRNNPAARTYVLDALSNLSVLQPNTKQKIRSTMNALPLANTERQLARAITTGRNNNASLAAVNNALSRGVLLKQHHLFDALSHKKFTVFNRLLQQPFMPINGRDDRGYTLLHVATENHATSIVEKLIRLGAHVNAKGHDHVTPLHLAAEHGYLDIAKILLNANANPELQENVNGFTPLHDAVHSKRPKIVNAILHHASNPKKLVNVRSFGGQTALHIAVKAKNLDMVKMLIAAGANPFIKTEGGRGIPARDAFSFAQNNAMTKALEEYWFVM